MEVYLHLTTVEIDISKGNRTEIISKALLVPEILEVIFKSLDTERLKRCRGVCLTWSNEIARLFHTRVIPVVSHTDWSKFQAELEYGKGLRRLIAPFQEMDARIKFGVLELRSFQELKSPLPLTRLILQDAAVHGRAGDDPELSKHVLGILRNCSETLTHLTTPFWTITEETSLANGFQLPRLRTLVAEGYEKSRELRDREFPFSMPELSFFLLIISAAPKLLNLTLNSLSAMPELLGQASLKKLQSLTVSGRANRYDTRNNWEALTQIDTEAIKSLRLDCLTFFEFGNDGVSERVFARFSNSLEILRFRFALCRLPLCPRVRTLHFRVELPINLSLFPALNQVVLSGETNLNWLNAKIKPCPTVSEVSIDRVDGIDNGWNHGEKLLKQLLRLFPSATFWRVNYRALEGFCQAAAEIQFFIERLEVNLNCNHPEYCIRDRPFVEDAAQKDLRTFSLLHLLTDLRELDLRQNLRCHIRKYSRGETWPGWKRLLPYNLGAIKFKSLRQLETLTIYADPSELPPDFNIIQDLNVNAELVVPSLRGGPPNWSDSIVLMSNVRILCEKTESSLLL